MGEYAPAALKWLAARIVAEIPSAVLSGIVGDARHVYGYHRARSKLPSSDYSVQLAADKAGDADAASAIDISLDAARMKLVTGRLLASAKDVNDPRLNYCREFYGTVNGTSVAGWDTYFGRSATSDKSHLWHVHISFLRKYATDQTAMAAVLSVILGEPYSPGDDMTPDELMAADVLPNRAWRGDFATNPKVRYEFGIGAMWDGIHRLEEEAKSQSARDAAILAAVAGQDVEKAIQAALAKAAESERAERAAERSQLVADLAPLLIDAIVAELEGGLPADVVTESVKTAVRQVLGSLDEQV